MIWVVYFLFACLSALAFALLLVGVFEPLARLLARRPREETLTICLGLPFLAAFLLAFGFATTVRPGGPYAALVGIGVIIAAVGGFLGGTVLGLLLLLSRWSRRGVVIFTVLAASLAWCSAGVEMLHTCEAVLRRVLPSVVMKSLLVGSNAYSQYTFVHAFLAGSVVAGVGLLTTFGIWRWQDRCAASRNGNH